MPHKIWGGVVGIFPIIDLAIQKFIIKKSAIRKAAECFGLSVEFAEEKKEEAKKREKEKKENPEKFNINIPDLSEDKAKTITGNKYEKDSVSNNVMKFVDGSVKLTTVTKEVNNVSKILDYSAKADYYLQQANHLEKIYSPLTFNTLTSPVFTSDIIEQKWNYFTDKGISFCDASSKVNILSSFGKGSILSVGLGLYCTHSFCEDLINKLAECYQQVTSERNQSYEEALSYFDI